MRTGIMIPNGVPGRTGQDLLTWARRTEDAGFDAICVLDRTVYDAADALVTLGAVAAVTSRVELATDVLVAPLRPVAQLAQQAATVDLLSGGRFTLGVGVGIRDDDFAAAGADYAGRGRAFDTQLAELAAIWDADGRVGPRPVRPGGPPLVVGGRPDLAGPRAARYGQGWTMGFGVPEQAAAGRAVVEEAFAASGRTDRPRVTALLYAAVGPDAAELTDRAIAGYYAWLGPKLVGDIVTTCAVGEHALAEKVAAFAAAGCDDLRLIPCSADVEQLDRLADVVLSTSLALPATSTTTSTATSTTEGVLL